MDHRGRVIGHLVGLVLAALGCLAPTAWVAGPAAAALLLWAPGHLLLRRLYRGQSCRGSHWLAVAASITLMPVPLAWVWRWSNSFAAILACVLGVNLMLLVVCGHSAAVPRPRAMFPTRRTRLLFAALLAWVTVCVFCAYWLPEAGGRVGTRAAHDYVKHHAVLLSLERYPLPLHNVFYAAEADTAYYYYEYHYLVPAALRKLTHDRLSVGEALGFTSALLAAAFLALTYLLARDVLHSSAAALFAAACVSIIGGWDVIPVALQIMGGGSPRIVLDSWSPVPWRIHNVATQFTWCPQHIAATLALLLACHALRRAPSARWWIWLGPMIGAAIFGTSVYLAMTIFLATAAYVGLRLLELRHEARTLGRTSLAVLAITALGVVLMGVQAWQYHLMGQRFPGGLTAQWDRFAYAFFGRLVPPGPLANYLDGWWIALVDFGLPGLALLPMAFTLRARLWRNAGMRLLVLVSAVGLVAVFTLRSNINPGFDYSFRVATIPANVLAAICAGALLRGRRSVARRRFWRRPVIVVGVLLGLPVGFYELPLTAVRSLVLKERHAADGGAISYLRTQTPPDAVVQGDPLERVSLPQLIQRQMGVLDPDNPHVRVFMPRDFAAMQANAAAVQQAFATESGPRAWTTLRRLGVTHVLVGSAERRNWGELPQFADASHFEIVYKDKHAAVYRLRTDVEGHAHEQRPASAPTRTESP
ncbi:MAG: hypothetical protein KKB50_22110 [Planctomycetes bacterium]|nr:hypothetical protein [Planctomycetota bacterium]